MEYLQPCICLKDQESVENARCPHIFDFGVTLVACVDIGIALQCVTMGYLGLVIWHA
jgi:hypothetical protein